MPNKVSAFHDKLVEIAGTAVQASDEANQMSHILADVGAEEDWPADD